MSMFQDCIRSETEHIVIDRRGQSSVLVALAGDCDAGRHPVVTRVRERPAKGAQIADKKIQSREIEGTGYDEHLADY
jgi:hypothetical protein